LARPRFTLAIVGSGSIRSARRSVAVSPLWFGRLRSGFDAEFLPTRRELNRVCQPAIKHHGPPLDQASLGEEQAGETLLGIKAHQTPFNQVFGSGRELGLPRSRAATPGLELEFPW
jgi:hypothetical protein